MPTKADIERACPMTIFTRRSFVQRVLDFILRRR